jgi:hypothetical protein
MNLLMQLFSYSGRSEANFHQELLRFVGRTHANIILTLSRPIRGELLYSNSLLSKAPQGGQKE